MNIGIIGCGLMGQRRAASLGDNKLVAVADVNIQKAYDIAAYYDNVKVFSDYGDLLKENVDIVIVSTINNLLAPIALNAIKSKKHVLIEKPGAIHYAEFDELIKEAKKNDVCVKVGYNLRFHPSFIKLIDILKMNNFGDVMFVRGRYGHGGRVEYEKEWRNNKFMSGGGELIDQGCHLIDLSMWILGDFNYVSGSVHNYFWDMNVEDNAFIHLKDNYGRVAWLHVSCTEWKNLFSFEIYFKHAKVVIEGLGGSYGIEKLTLYEMLSGSTYPKTTSWEFYDDKSSELEINNFIKSIEGKLPISSNLNDSQKVLKIISKIYKDNKI